MHKAVVVGASTGIGRELAKQLHAGGYRVGLMARRAELLHELRDQLGAGAFVKVCDVANIQRARECLKTLIDEMGGVDLVILSAGTGHLNPELTWGLEEETIAVNATAFAALAGVSWAHFVRRGHGHLVGISSIACLTGNGAAPAYNATKAFASNYLAGLRQKAHKEKLAIVVTDVRPGFVDTAMAKGPGQFWVASPAKAAAQILRAIDRKKSIVYITRRWRLIAWLLQLIPEPIARRI